MRADDRGKAPIARELGERAAWKIADDHGPLGRTNDRGLSHGDAAGPDDGRREDTGLGALAVDLRDRSHGRFEGLDLGFAARPLERRPEKRRRVADQVVDRTDRGGAVLVFDGLERNSDREWRIDRDRDREATHVGNDAFERCWSPQGTHGVRRNDHLGGRGGAGGHGRAHALIRCERPHPRAADALKSSELGDERAEQLFRLALSGETAQRSCVDAGPERVHVLATEGPDDLGDHEADRDERLHRPQVGRAGLLAAGDQSPVVADDRECRRGDRSDRSGPQRRDADRERVEDPRAELERKRQHQTRDRRQVHHRHNEGGPLKWGVVPHGHRSREIQDQDQSGEGGGPDTGEKDEGPAERDGGESNEQVGALTRFDGRGRSPHCALSNVSEASCDAGFRDLRLRLRLSRSAFASRSVACYQDATRIVVELYDMADTEVGGVEHRDRVGEPGERHVELVAIR